MNLCRHVISLACALTALSAAAITPAEAKKAFEQGDFEEAAPVLAAEARKSPKDAVLNTQAGIALYHTGNEAEAVTYLKRGTNEANLYLARIAMHRYHFDQAEEYVDKYEDGFKKSRRAQRPERPEATEVRRQIDMGRNMLERVERVVIIDSIDVDRDKFFLAYNLAPSAGSLRPADQLPGRFEAADPTVVFATEGDDQIFWAMPDENEDFRIATSSLLADNTWEKPTLLPDLLNEGGDANYPFMMSDGVTLYYGSTGENSLGGYDIFLSRRDGDTWYQPQNIGMPYNSYANDYMLAIDELTGAGWWATDRNAAPDRLTVYVFVPSDLRVNYPIDFPGLAERALLTSWRDTQPDGADYSGLLAAIRAASSDTKADGDGFRFAVPTKGIYTAFSDFRQPQARKLMKEYLDMQQKFELDRRRLQVLRDKYARGNRASASEILTLEADIERQRGELRYMSNRIVAEENR